MSNSELRPLPLHTLKPPHTSAVKPPIQRNPEVDARPNHKQHNKRQKYGKQNAKQYTGPAPQPGDDGLFLATSESLLLFVAFGKGHFVHFVVAFGT